MSPSFWHEINVCQSFFQRLATAHFFFFKIWQQRACVQLFECVCMCECFNVCEREQRD